MGLIPKKYFANPQQQILINSHAGKRVINGPSSAWAGIDERVEVREGVLLNRLSFAKVQDTMTGETRVEEGPKLLFLGAYDVIIERGEAVSLGKDRLVYFVDGALWLHQGNLIFPL
jgi:hypothetical protein